MVASNKTSSIKKETVSVFKKFNEPIEEITMIEVLKRIHDGLYKTQIEKLRKIITYGNKKKYDKLKKDLPAFTPSGYFEGGRKLQFLLHYSGFIILDIDKLTIEQLTSAFKIITKAPYTYACFRSPSNNGLKVLVKCDSNYLSHYRVYDELKNHYEQLLNLPIDTSGKDLTRLCFFSYDEELFINIESETFKTVTNMIENDIKKVVEQIEAGNLDITNGYLDWLKIGFALADALGEAGRTYFHRISKFNEQYNLTECDKQFNNCLKSNKAGATAKTLFYIAKNYGIDISPDNSTPMMPLTTNTKKKPANEKTKSNLFDKIEKYLENYYTLRYNVVTGKIEVQRKGHVKYEPMTDYFENTIFRKLHKSNINVSMAKLRCILQSDFCKCYDPFKEYFEGLPEWDEKTDYIKQLAETVKTTQNELWLKFFQKWIVAVVASLLDAFVVNHTAIIFSGAQGIGKTTWLEKLCPPELSDYLFSGTINPNNKDTLIQLVECMFINMDELENMNRTEIGTLKEIITKSAIRIRRPYGHNNDNLTRRASFMGSVNTSQFLNDSTGSRRFLCFEAIEILYQHNVDLKMVYAQAFYLWKNNFCYYFDKEESTLISGNNEKYQIHTVEEELLLVYFKPVNKNECNSFLTTTQILSKLTNNMSNGSLISLGKALKKHGFLKAKKGGVYVWAVNENTPDEIDYNNQTKPDETKN